MSDPHAPPESEVDITESSTGLYDWGDNVDTSTFEQILEMDDDEDEKEFSRSIVIGFFEQAETTFLQIETALESKDLPKLSSLGHFLKGSSATLGLTKVKNSCEKIQHFGQKKDQEGIADEEDEEKCLKRIEETFQILKKDYIDAVNILKTFFGMSSQSESTNEDGQNNLDPQPKVDTITVEASSSNTEHNDEQSHGDDLKGPIDILV
ncbi:Multistep phosphorelay regulator 1 [Erysiphe neolycopersici]|uniref:Multistep phosphorelay regulator 1 n=1 Tax=Erysiphe neolycopersici TaxID=212602 RepID=A0A420HNR9_9PEZI|nr:Multistep phosphorelay regulator 1 [Erysiphe neolycopersici]